jgi:hypothetical protein
MRSVRSPIVFGQNQEPQNGGQNNADGGQSGTKAALLKRIAKQRYTVPVAIALVFGTLSVTSFIQSSSASTDAYSFWSNNVIPRALTSTDTNSAEVGLKFYSKTAGQITAIRFYKGAENKGLHSGTIWSKSGADLASVAFENETATGWQEATLKSPITVTPNTTYIVSYHAPLGHYSTNAGYFKTGSRLSHSLVALKHSTDEPNGVFAYGNKTTFPNTAADGTNFWVDVVFLPNAN